MHTAAALNVDLLGNTIQGDMTYWYRQYLSESQHRCRQYRSMY